VVRRSPTLEEKISDEGVVNVVLPDEELGDGESYRFENRLEIYDYIDMGRNEENKASDSPGPLPGLDFPPPQRIHVASAFGLLKTSQNLKRNVSALLVLVSAISVCVSLTPLLNTWLTIQLRPEPLLLLVSEPPETPDFEMSRGPLAVLLGGVGRRGLWFLLTLVEMVLRPLRSSGTTLFFDAMLTFQSTMSHALLPIVEASLSSLMSRQTLHQAMNWYEEATGLILVLVTLSYLKIKFRFVEILNLIVMILASALLEPEFPIIGGDMSIFLHNRQLLVAILFVLSFSVQKIHFDACRENFSNLVFFLLLGFSMLMQLPSVFSLFDGLVDRSESPLVLRVTVFWVVLMPALVALCLNCMRGLLSSNLDKTLIPSLKT